MIFSFFLIFSLTEKSKWARTLLSGGNDANGETKGGGNMKYELRVYPTSNCSHVKIFEFDVREDLFWRIRSAWGYGVKCFDIFSGVAKPYDFRRTVWVTDAYERLKGEDNNEMPV